LGADFVATDPFARGERQGSIRGRYRFWANEAPAIVNYLSQRRQIPFVTTVTRRNGCWWAKFLPRAVARFAGSIGFILVHLGLRLRPNACARFAGSVHCSAIGKQLIKREKVPNMHGCNRKPRIR
jgi:hypothetical protein